MMRCDIKGCMASVVAGIHWDHVYAGVCREHHRCFLLGDPLLPRKQRAIKREKSRDPMTGQLPPRTAS